MLNAQITMCYMVIISLNLPPPYSYNKCLYLIRIQAANDGSMSATANQGQGSQRVTSTGPLSC